MKTRASVSGRSGPLAPPWSALDQTDLHGPAAIDVGARVEGIVQDVVDEAVGGELEDHFPAAVARAVDGQLEALVVKPLESLPDAPGLLEHVEDEGHGLLHAEVGVFDDAAGAVDDIARRQQVDQLSALGLGRAALGEPLLQHLQFDDTQRAFDARGPADRRGD